MEDTISYYNYNKENFGDFYRISWSSHSVHNNYSLDVHVKEKTNSYPYTIKVRVVRTDRQKQNERLIPRYHSIDPCSLNVESLPLNIMWIP